MWHLRLTSVMIKINFLGWILPEIILSLFFWERSISKCDSRDVIQHFFVRGKASFPCQVPREEKVQKLGSTRDRGTLFIIVGVTEEGWPFHSKKKERIGDNEPRDFYFNLLVRGENCETWRFIFQGWNFFFFSEEKAGLDFFLLRFGILGKVVYRSESLNTREWKDFLGAEFNGEIWNFGFSEASSNFQPQKKNLNRYKFSTFKH